MPPFIPSSILITGATGGIGSALAERYADKNKTLILTGRNAQRLEEVATICRQKGANVITKALDIVNTKSLAEWLQQVLDKMTVNLVIANAGISAGLSQNGEFESLEKTIEVLNVNLFSVINTIYPILNQMRIKKCGQIAIMSSLAAFRGLPQSPAYCASKAAIRIYGESLRTLLRKENVLVSVICPGFIKTAMSDRVSGPKPYLMSPSEAAAIIKAKLQNKKSEIVFPKQLKLGIDLINFLPKRIVDNLLTRFKTYISDA